MTRTYLVGRALIGVRTNDAGVDDLLRTVLAAHVVPDVVAPYANYSVRLEPRATGRGAQSLHTLYEGGCLVTRSRHAAEVVDALLHHLSVPELERHERTLVRCTLLRRADDGGAILVSAVSRREAIRRASRLRRQGLELVNAPAVQVDPDSGEVLVPVPSLTVDRTPLEVLVGHRRSDDGSGSVGRRFAVSDWVFMSAPGAFSPMSRVEALPLAAHAVINLPASRTESIRSLAALLRRTSCIAAGDLLSPDVLDRIPSLVSNDDSRAAGPPDC